MARSEQFDELECRLEPLLAMVADRAEEANRSRRPSRSVLKALAEVGMLRLVVPAALGGLEVHPADFLRLIERLARVDGSTAWTVMTCNEEAGIASAHLDSTTLAELFSAEPSVLISGSGVPRGQAERTADGWRVTGRWDFISGSTASDYVVLNNRVDDGGDTLRFCHVLVPTAEVTIEDTWHTVGLRGTASNDVVLDGHHVPAAFAGENPAGGPARPDTPFYRLPSGLRFPFPKVGVAAGLAGAAIDEFRALAEGKRPLFHRGNLRERASAQDAAARAEALRASGLAWVFEQLDEVWAVASTGDPVPEELHARARLACSHAVSASIDAIEGLCREAGSSANRVESPLGGLLADCRAVAGHFMVAPYQMTTAGRVLLGLDTGDPGF